MKKFYYIAMFVAMFAMACENNETKNDYQDSSVTGNEINIEEVACDNVDDLLVKCDDTIDGNEVQSVLKDNGVVFVQAFELRDGKWCDNRAPGGFGVVGFVIKDDACHIYGYAAPIDADSSKFICETYDCLYDVSNAQILTKSKHHDFKYSAKVIYLKDDTIIFDGVLGMDDYLNDNYAERRVVYLCKLDDEAPSKWSESVD